jgi:hypothetical protein
MTIKANLEDGRVLNFPDGTDPQVIQAAVKKVVAFKKPFSVASFNADVDTQPQEAIEQTQTTEPEIVRPLTIKSMVSQAVSNTPKSAQKFVEDTLAPFLSPVETAKAIGKLGLGLAEKFIPGTQDDEKIVDDLVDAFKERYGGVENIKKSIADDPVGIVGDVVSMLIPGGAAVKGVGTVTKIKKIASLGEKISKVGKALDPLTAISKVSKKSIGKLIPKELPSKLFESAAKFSTTLPVDVRRKLASTALTQRIMPTVKGLDKIRTKVNKFNDEITTLIDTATDQGKKIPVQALFTKFGDLRKVMSGEPITRGRQISKVAKEISVFFKGKGKKFLTPAEAQELKKAIYKETESYYSKVANNPARIDAKQAIAKAAKESIEDIFPEIKQLNQAEGALLALRKELEKSASRISNRDLLGIGVPIKATAAGAAGGPIGVLGGIAIGLFDTPNVKAKLAIILQSIKDEGVVLSKDSLLSKIIEAAPKASTVRQAEKVRSAANN